VCNDTIVALKLQAEAVSVLIVLVCVPTMEYENGEVQALNDVIKTILAEDGNGVTNITIMDSWNRVVRDKSYRYIVVPHRFRKGSRYII
jgi:hypothetical protein